MTTPNIVFGMVIATLMGALFHLWRGGNLGRLLFYILAAWFGFWVGQVIGSWLGLDFLGIGTLRLGAAISVTIVVLLIGHWLVQIDSESEPDESAED